MGPPPDILTEAIAGVSAGILGTLIGHPLDTIKTRMQTQNPVASNPARGIADAAREIGRRGLGGFYRGVGGPLVSLTILNTVSFSAYSQFRRTLNVNEGEIEGVDGRVVLAGAMIAPLSSMISTPFEMVKIQMQTDGSAPKGSRAYKSSIHAVQRIVREYGVARLYQGFNVNVIREATFLAVYFGVYEHGKLFVRSLPGIAAPHRDRPNAQESERGACKPGYANHQDAWIVPVVGGLAGAAAWIAATPFDTLKTMVQGHAVLVEPQSKRTGSTTSPIATVVSALSASPAATPVAAAASAGGGGGCNPSNAPFRQTPAQAVAQTHTQAYAQPEGSSRSFRHRSKWPGAMETWQLLLNEGGVRRLYAGCGPSVLRAIVTSSSRFSAYECTRYFMNKHFSEG